MRAISLVIASGKYHPNPIARALSRVAASVALVALGTAAPVLGGESASGEHTHGAELAAEAPRADLSIYQLDSLWTDDGGEEVTLAFLEGRPVVLAMIYTSCEYVCPLLVEDVKQIEAALVAADRERVRFVLVSFDPARDTPEALAAYREKRRLSRDGWVLLTGTDDDVLTLAAVLGVRYKPDGRGDFAHSNLVTVLDEEGVVRHQQVGVGQDSAATKAVLHRLLQE